MNNLNSNYSQNQNQYSLTLPIKIKASLKRKIEIGPLDFIRLKIKHMPIIYENPEITCLFGLNSNYNNLELGIKYGISQKASLVMNTNIKLKKLSLNIRTENLEYIIDPNNSYGLSLLFGLKINLK